MLSLSSASASRLRAARTVIAGFVRGSGAVCRVGREEEEAEAEDGFWGKAELGERVGFGCTGPSSRSERAKSGSEASRLMAVVPRMSVPNSTP